MKKLLAIILSLVMVISLAACGSKTEVNEVGDDKEVVETNKTEDTNNQTTEKEEIKKEEPKKEESKKEEVKKEEPKKEEVKKEEPQKEEPKKEETKKEETKPTTLGTTLLSDFKKKAASGMGAQEIADALITSPYIKFAGGAMPVEEGYLSGFDNTEIKGFKNGVMFAPMIGSIAFVGYIFELENASDVSTFISTLEKNANKRWNICVEADEIVTGSAGNKVFFVMCPESLEE